MPCRANFVALYSFVHVVPVVNLDKPVLLDQLNLNSTSTSKANLGNLSDLVNFQGGNKTFAEIEGEGWGVKKKFFFFFILKASLR